MHQKSGGCRGNMEFGKSNWMSYAQGIRKEWLLTNGIGGFSSSTLIGANTRRYHGLLTASLKPPVQRHLVLSKIDEAVTIGEKTYNLYSFSSGSSGEFEMKGFHHLQRVVFDPLPTFIYSIGDVIIEKTISMVYGENTVLLLYRVINGECPLNLRLTPLLNFRDYHHISRRHHMRFRQNPFDGGTAVKPYDIELEIKLACPGERFSPLENTWFEGMFYHMERERGLDCSEDHYIPGYFDIRVEGGQEKTIAFFATVEKESKITDAALLVDKEKARLTGLVEQAGCADDFAAALTLGADKFIVYRKSTDAKTIIAGYPWFTDWGRDTMIALSGLTLTTKRFEDAKQILYTFASYVKHGLVPNMFPDEGQEPAYNSVDAALWYFEAVNKYLQYTGDSEFVLDNLYESLQHIVHFYMTGTLYNIGMDTDGLIYAGDKATQLTWMDAKVGSWVVTPRHGKAVEINALWYNALRIMADFSDMLGNNSDMYSDIAEGVMNAFRQTFWNENKKCLYDVVAKDHCDDSVRPNQIIALSLSYPVLDGEMARAVVRKVWKELYTSYGLRTLDQTSPHYRGAYAGDPYMRDGAYHQGTVWTWPLGHFITAFRRVFGNEGKYGKILEGFMAPFRDHIMDACIGSISEIFDGDEPLTPRGCFAQAWSVGEILRVYTEDISTVKRE